MSIEVRRNTKLNGIEVVVADETKKRQAQIDKDLRSLGFMFSKRKNLYFTKYNKTLYKDVQEMFEDEQVDESAIPFGKDEPAKTQTKKAATKKADTKKATKKTTAKKTVKEKYEVTEKQMNMFTPEIKTAKPETDLTRFVPALRTSGPRTELKGQYPDFATWKSAVLQQVEELLDEAIAGLAVSIESVKEAA